MKKNSKTPTAIIRARALVMHEGHILLMHRVKPDIEYYTFCGGKVEPGETPEQACVREVLEETSIRIKVDREIYRCQDMFENIPNTHIVYACTYLSGEPVLGGEELARSTADNFYRPLWLPLEQLDTVLFMPPFLRPVLEQL